MIIYGFEATGPYSIPPPPGPPEPLGSFDFVNGVYSWGVTSLSASDVTDKTAWIGADGLAVPQSQPAGAQILYTGATTLLGTCDFTVVFEIEKVSTNAADILTIYDSGDMYQVQVIVDGSYYELNDYDGLASRYSDDNVNGQTLAVHKVAITTTATRASISIDGNEVVTSAVMSSLPVIGSPMTKFYLGGTDVATYKAVNIHSIVLYDTQDDSALPALSAL